MLSALQVSPRVCSPRVLGWPPAQGRPVETGLEEFRPRRSPPPVLCGLLVSLTSPEDQGALALGTAVCVSAPHLPAAVSPRSAVESPRPQMLRRCSRCPGQDVPGMEMMVPLPSARQWFHGRVRPHSVRTRVRSQAGGGPDHTLAGRTSSSRAESRNEGGERVGEAGVGCSGSGQARHQ